MVKPAQHKEMALKTVVINAVSIRLACQAFCISEACYRYQPKKRACTIFCVNIVFINNQSHDYRIES